MSQAQLFAAGLEGIDAYPLEVEVNVCRGLPRTVVVGLPDAALRESRQRVKSAITASGYTFPNSELVIVNLVPAHRRKEAGAAFDLPIALGILAAHDDQIEPKALHGVAALGELTLSGRARAFRGALAAGQAIAAAGARRLLIARASAASAALGCSGRVDVIPIDTLAEAVGVLRKTLKRDPLRLDPADIIASPAPEDALDLADVRGAEGGKHAVEIAAAGGHDLLLVGPPGTGKTMLARRLPGLLPRPSLEEVLEITRIHGVVCGPADSGWGPDEILVRRRPFRAPHHTASYVALVGGGTTPRPGEISLALHSF